MRSLLVAFLLSVALGAPAQTVAASQVMPGSMGQTLSTGPGGRTQWVSGSSTPAALFPGADIGAQVNAAIQAVGCGSISIPAGTFHFSTTIAKPRCVHLEGQGVQSTVLVWTPVSGAAVAIGDAASAKKGGGIMGLSITTSARSSTAVALWLGGDTNGTILPSASQAEGQTFIDIGVGSGFDRGVVFANHAYKELFVNSLAFGTLSAAITMQAGSSDNAEDNQFVGGTIFNNAKYAIKGCPDCRFTGTSFDYNWGNGTAGGSPDITGATINCSQCHFEKVAGPFSNSGLACSLCDFLLTGSTGTEPYLLSGTGDASVSVSQSDVFSSHPVTAFARFDGTGGSTGSLILRELTGNGNGAIAATYAFGALPPWSYNIDDGLLHTKTVATRSQSYESIDVTTSGKGYTMGGASLLSYETGGSLIVHGLFGLVKIRPKSNDASWSDTGLNARPMAALFNSVDEDLGEPITAASTISPTKGITVVGGSATISTIKPFGQMDSVTGGCIKLAAAAGSTWRTTTSGGNILTAITASPGHLYTGCWIGTGWVFP